MVKTSDCVVILKLFFKLLALRMEDLDTAIQYFHDVIKNDEENVNAAQNIADAYARTNQAEAAEKWNVQVGG